jgi:hypothetical protein
MGRSERIVEGAEAANRCAETDAAGIEADQIESLGYLGPIGGTEEGPGPEYELDTGPTGAAGVEQDRTDAVGRVRGRHPDQGNRDRRPVRPVVVEGSGHGGALVDQPGLLGDVLVAGLPADRAVAFRAGGGLGRRQGRPDLRRRLDCACGLYLNDPTAPDLTIHPTTSETTT